MKCEVYDFGENKSNGRNTCARFRGHLHTIKIIIIIIDNNNDSISGVF